MKHWKRKDARDAYYIIKYYKPNLILKSVSITDRKKDNKFVPKGTKTSTIPGEYGLFISFKRKGMQKGEKLPYFTNGWNRSFTLMSALKRFFYALRMYEGIIKNLKKISPNILNSAPFYHEKKQDTIYHKSITNFLKEIHYVCYWLMTEDVV